MPSLIPPTINIEDHRNAFWIRGEAAAARGYPRKCPFGSRSANAMAWFRGWDYHHELAAHRASGQKEYEARKGTAS